MKELKVVKAPSDSRLQRLVNFVLEDYKIGREAVKTRINYPHSYTIPFMLELGESFGIDLPLYAQWKRGRVPRHSSDEYDAVVESILDKIFEEV